jgi:Mor family transcriptional regulator
MQTSSTQRDTSRITLSELGPLHAQLGADIPKQIREIAELLYIQLIEVDGRGNQAQMARCARLAVLQTERLRKTLGGQNLYINKGRVDTSNRDRLIAEEFTGRNLRALASKFQLSEQSIRNITKRTRRFAGAVAHKGAQA